MHQACLVLRQIDFLHEEMTAREEGDIRLFANTTAETEFLPEALATLMSERPGVRVDLQERLTHDIVRSVADGTAVLGIVSGEVSKRGLDVKSFEAMCRMIEAGVGIGVVPESAARHHEKTMEIRLLYLEDDWATRDRHVLVRDKDAPSRSALALIELLESNTSDLNTDTDDIVTHYKALADIGRGFRVMKSAFEIDPVYHRRPDRIRAHACICFMALITHRMMRQRLKQADSGISPERALETLIRFQRHEITLNTRIHKGITSLSDEHKSLLDSLSVSKPAESTQLPLL